MKRFLAFLAFLLLAFAPVPAAAQLLLTGAGAAPSGGGGGGVTATFRSSSNVNSGGHNFTLALPTGAAAGDALTIIADDAQGITPVVTMGSGAVLTSATPITTSYGKAYAYGYKLVAGDIGSPISIDAGSTGDSYWLAVDYAISGGSVATFTFKDSQVVASGSMAFGSFSPSGSTITTVCLMYTFNPPFTYSTPATWTADVNSANVAGGFAGGAFSKASGSAPTFTGFTSQAFGFELELAS